MTIPPPSDPLQLLADVAAFLRCIEWTTLGTETDATNLICRIEEVLFALGSSASPSSDPAKDELLKDAQSGMDGLKWAKAFCAFTGFADVEWAHSWFANAIMAGYDEANRRSSASPSIDPAQDGLYDARTCRKCGIEAIDYVVWNRRSGSEVICVSCQSQHPPSSPSASEGEAKIAARIAEWVRSCREDDTDRPRVQVFDVMASHIAKSDWSKAEVIKSPQYRQIDEERVRGALAVVIESAGRCGICGDVDSDAHLSEPHMFEPVDPVQLFRDELSLVGLRIASCGDPPSPAGTVEDP